MLRVARAAAGTIGYAVVGIVAATATACNLDRALKVDDVDVATPESVGSAAGLNVLYAGGRSDTQNAITGTDAAITMPGLLADELRDIDTFPTRIEVDQRQTQVRNGTVQTWYRNMHQARASLVRATEAFHKYKPTDARLAELHALEGLIYVLFGEDFCNGVAYSKFVDGQPQYGPANTPAQTFQLAVSQADSAIGLATANSAELYLASIVKGRALLNLGQPAAAVTAVQGVPVDFQYWVYNSENSTRENNGVYVNVGPVSKRFGVADIDGVNGLAFRSQGMDTTKNTGDPRVRWYKSGVGQDGSSPAYYQVKYPSRSAAVVVADGIEAQLVIAENQLKNNDANWLTTLNALRSNSTLLNRAPYTYPGMPTGALAPLSDPGAPASRVDLLFRERAFWMYLTGHRLGDLRRLIKQYTRDPETVFPSGPYQGAAGGSTGADVNFPIPIDEQNNLAAPACTDRSP
jgi:hypothetical protein